MPQVSPNAKKSLVFSITSHPNLDSLLKPYVVQHSPNGQFSLIFEHLIFENLKFFPGLVTEEEAELIQKLDLIMPEAITRKFAPVKKIKPKDFFEKNMSQLLLRQSIRPYIDRINSEVLNARKGSYVYLFDHKNPTHQQIDIPEEESTVLFHLRRNEEGTHYFLTIKCGDQVFNQFHRDAMLISSKPCWLLVGNKLLHFSQEFDGNKLMPFMEKTHIRVAPNAEEQFYKKFALPLFEQFQVVAKGIQVETEKYEATPVLRLEQHISGRYVLNLMFLYGSQLFMHHSGKQVSASLVRVNGEITIRKIKRSRQWEEIKADVLIGLGLEKWQNSSYVLPEEDGLYALIAFLTQKKTDIARAGFEIRQHLNREAFFLGASELNISVQRRDDWFDLTAKVKFGPFEIPFIQLRRHILNGNREFELPNGQIALIPEEWFHRLSPVLEQEEEGKIRSVHIGLLQESVLPFMSGHARQELLKDFDHVESVDEPEHFSGSLRPYQKAGYDWFWFLSKFNFGGCLADDMGLGKTIQTLALLLKLKEQWLAEKKESNQEIETEPIEISETKSPQLNLFDSGKKGNRTISNVSRPVHLLVVPASLVFNWMEESTKFSPSLRFINHTGTTRNRSTEPFRFADVVITTYGTLRKDLSLLTSFEFCYIILDESQLIKNADSATARAVRSLKGRHKLTLTGTPIENSVEDIWSQMQFLNPGLLGGISSFRKNYKLPIEKENDFEKLRTLQAMLKPFILRRTKGQVAGELPEKTEQIIYCDMPEKQRVLYEEVKSSYRNAILENIVKFGVQKSRMQILKGLTELRQLANHPQLTGHDEFDESGKFFTLLEMANTALKEGHKVLLFSQFVRFLEMFRKHFEKEQIQYAYLDGSVKSADRAKQVQEFQQNPLTRIFLISLKAGGTGLNLTEADYVFIADPWWNPASEKQAIDRSHRIGQTKKVFSYKFITRETVEEKILQLQKKKLEISDSLIQKEDTFVKQLSASDIEALFS